MYTGERWRWSGPIYRSPWNAEGVGGQDIGTGGFEPIGDVYARNKYRSVLLRASSLTGTRDESGRTDGSGSARSIRPV